MTKKFRDTWANQSELGKEFALSAVELGKKLKELGLRQANGTPTQKAAQEGYCIVTPLKNGTPFFLWHREKIKTLLESNGLHVLSREELRHKNLAENLLEAERLDDQGSKLAHFIYDETIQRIRPDDLPSINRFLQEAGSQRQVTLEELWE